MTSPVSNAIPPATPALVLDLTTAPPVFLAMTCDGQQCVSNGCFTGCKTCADPSQSQCYTCLDGYSFLQVNGYLGQCLQQCPQLYFVTVISSTISLCHAKNLVTNQLMYGSSSTQVKIMMSGYLAYDYNVVVSWYH